jgi:hypothetical protein
MNYNKIYSDLMNKRKEFPINELCHKHHIIPTCLGGSNDKDNIVKLSYREHYIAHKLLVKIYTGKDKKKMVYALWKMTISNSKNILFGISSRSYEAAKILYSQENPQKDKVRIEKWKENHKNGKYNYDYDQVGTTLSNTLKKLTDDEMTARMKNSVGNCDHKLRAKAISRGKSSLLRAIYPNGDIIEFLSCYAVDEVGISYGHIKDLIKRKNGIENNIKYEYIRKYPGNNQCKKKSLSENLEN